MSTSEDLSDSAAWQAIVSSIRRVAPEWRAQDPSIVSIRPGFYRENGRLTDTKAVIVEVDPTHTGPPMAAVPRELDGYRVDVVAADPLMALNGEQPLAAWARAHDASAVVTEAAAPNIGYTPPTDFQLEAMAVRNVVCHVGPDSGWSNLQAFLSETRERLSVSMYDFTAEHIVDEIESLGRAAAPRRSALEMILDQKSDEVDNVEAVRNVWGERFIYAPAVVHGANRLFANAYHTKIAVRDGTAFWQSSGNWSPNSQPVVPDGEQSPYRLGNREWHVIIRDARLAGLLEKYVRWDRDQAARAAVAELAGVAPELPDLLVPESALLELEAAVVQPEPFGEQEFAANASDEPIDVQPLMTPDNYGDRILELIGNARSSLLMQFAYIRQPSYPGVLEELVKAVAKKMKSKTMHDVRVIVDSRNQTPAHIEYLLGLGFSPDKFRKQRSKVHNKGIIVDGRYTVVGSQNWSSDGVQFNRDASLLFDSPEIAAYYTNVFDFDWQNLTKPVQTAEVAPVIAESAQTPRGMVRVPWSTWYGE